MPRFSRSSIEIEIDLAGADHDATDLVVLDQLDAFAAALRIVPQHAVEERALGDVARCVETQRLWRSRRLRRHQDQRLAEVALQLTAQDVEVVRRRRAVGDLHVVLGAHLQPALEARGGMLRTLAFIAVRQKADEARHAQPLALARRDELVEHDLRAVGEVAELRLPQGRARSAPRGCSRIRSRAPPLPTASS